MVIGYAPPKKQSRPPYRMVSSSLGRELKTCVDWYVVEGWYVGG